jgi:hypothetical protein
MPINDEQPGPPLSLVNSLLKYDPSKAIIQANDIPEDEIILSSFQARRKEPKEQLNHE